ncbi:MAG: alpha-2-macroglobulin domain protein [Caulobacteraceae bacterium]|nr:alpha-2-macroglobulin domain protein [Caulobacteraceae bacterium]
MGSGDDAPSGRGRDLSWLKRPVTIFTIAGVLAGFGGGYLTAKGLEGLPAAAGANSARATDAPAWPFFGKPRSASAKRAAPPRPDGFAVWQQRIDTSGAEPVACIRMSRPLDPARAYGDFVLVSPNLNGKPAVSAKGEELCIGGLGFVDRKVTLLKGLPSAKGDVLTADADVEIAFGDRPPFVGFAGDGVILPREEADGVGIETINVSQLRVQVWRVPDRNLVRQEIATSDPVGEDEYDYDGQSGEGRKVWTGLVPVRGKGAERVTTVFPLGAVLKDMKPGGYVIAARDASGETGKEAKTEARGEDGEGGDQSERRARARRWVIFTDMALTTYSGAQGLDVVVRSLQSAKTLSGVKLTLVAQNGEDLASGTADGSGRIHFDKPLLDGEGGGRAKMVMAYGPQGDLAVLDLTRSPVDLSKQGVDGRTEKTSVTDGRVAGETVDGYLYADRGIYRPGETVHLVAMVRDRTAAAVKERKGVLIVTRPSGVEFARFAFDKADAGVVTKDILLPKSAPRGRWTARLDVAGGAGSAGELSFSVEDFAPQRLAVDTEADAERPLVAGETRPVRINARFLYGAPGAGLQTQIESRIAADPNPFPQYPDYRFGDETVPFQEVVPETVATVTDGAGKAVMNFAAAEGGPALVPLRATVTAAVFEPGGRPVRESVSLKLRPRPLYLGVKVGQGDATRGAAPVSFDMIAVNGMGARVAASGLTWALIAEHWQYDWYQQDGRWRWRRSNRDVVVERGTGATSPAAALRYTRRLEWGDYRIEVTAPDGSRAVTKFAAGWGSPAKESDSPDFVRVSAGSQAYAQGDTIDIAIKGPYAGEAQVAVATDRIIDFKTVKLDDKGGHIKLRSNADWGGGAYVLVSLIQPRDPGVTPKPRRAIGLVYVPLDPKQRKLSVAIGTAVKGDARNALKVPVKVNGLGAGQRAHVTLAAVDEGILRLTRFESPDPVKWYFGKRALGVDLRDDYGRLLDPNLGAAAALNYGADAIGGEGLTVTPIKTVALWSGVVETGLDGKATIQLPAPAFNGELRLMAVAWTDNQVGSGAKAITVREPVVAELNLPRFLAPGDRALATLELHNLDGRAGSYDAQLASAGGLASPFRKPFALSVGQRITERAPVSAPNAASIGRVDLRVAGPGFTTVRSYPIQTRIGWGAQTRTVTALQGPGDSFTPTPDLMAGLTDVTLQVSYSPVRGFDPSAVALALQRYPYGCTEQLVSTAYPLLYAARLSSDAKVRRSTLALNEAVGKLVDRQSMDGAFGLWRVGDGEADPWLGAYTTDFLLEAKVQGAPVPDVAIERALQAMRLVSKPDGWASVSYMMQYPPWWMLSADGGKRATERMRSRASAYALYVLAKGGRGDLARLRWWHDVQMKQDLSPIARAQVGAGLAMMGDRARARSALQAAAAGLGYRDEADYYQSPLRDVAAVITYAYEAGELDIARSLQARLEAQVKDPDRLNTQEQARLLQAAAQMVRAAGPVNVAAAGSVRAEPSVGGPRWLVGTLADARFVNNGKGAVYRTVTVRGVPLAAPHAAQEGLGLSKTLWTMNGARVDPDRVGQGERVIVQVSGANRQGRSLMLVVDDPLPAGFEIETVLGPGDAQNGPFRFLGQLTAPNVQESRDDRYIASLKVAGNKGFTFAYVARAVTPGAFFLPGAEARDMYRPAVYGRTEPGRLTIAAGP